LDNIDNVIRAGKSLGFHDATGRLAESLAASFVFHEGNIVLSEEAREFLERWQKIRFKLYDLIYHDIKDFSLETMIKHAIKILIECGQFRKDDWRLTEYELVYHRMMNNPETRKILTRIKLADFYPCLGIFSIRTNDPSTIVHEIIPRLENCLKDFLKIEPILTNYFIDKRWRTRDSVSLHRPLTTFMYNYALKDKISRPGVIVGVFTSKRMSEIRSLSRNVSFANLKELVESLLPKGSELHFINVYSGRRSCNARGKLL